MSVINLRRILPAVGGGLTVIDSSTLPVKYAGKWSLNASTNRTTSGVICPPPSQWTLDTSFPNVKASNLLLSSTSAFAIQIPVQGTYTFAFYGQINMTIANAAVQSGAIYLGAQTYNGITNIPVNTAPEQQYRFGSQFQTFSNPTGGTGGYTFAQVSTATRECKAGDIIQPWFFTDAATNTIVGGTGSNMASSLTVTLLNQTA